MEEFSKNQIIERVMKRAKELKISPRKVSIDSGHGPDLIRDWKGAKSPLPRLDSILKIARVLQVEPGWLAYGSGEKKRAEIDDVTFVPLISWVAASPFAESGHIEEVKYAEKVPVSHLGSGRFFALRVQGDSMNLIAPEGSLIIVDGSERELLPRKFFVFQSSAGATFKRYMINPPRLEPYTTNPAHEALALDEDTVVIGRAVKVVTDL
jgi:SOS-response transcriptional repressor LexA